MPGLACSQKLLLDSITSSQEEMLQHTISLANTNSGSYHHAGLIKTQQQLDEIFGIFCDVQHIELSAFTQVNDSGKTQQIKPPPASLYQCNRNAKFQILCTGHSDTVFDQHCEFQQCWIEGNHLRGPGVADMKGGLMVLFQAMKAIRKSVYSNRVGFNVLVSPDEEIGSLASAPLLTKLASQADVGLVYEPALADGTLAGERKGSGNFSIVVKGLSSHAGRDYYAGKNAILAAAKLSLALVSLNNKSQGITVNIGKIAGGAALNQVADNCVVKFNIRISQPAHQQQINSAIKKILQNIENSSGCQLQLFGKFNRPPKPSTPKQLALQQRLQQCGKQLGVAISYQATGGCCEGNNLSAAGLANIDTLGVRGGAIHSDQEFACIDSFVERAQLSALFISQLCQ